MTKTFWGMLAGILVLLAIEIVFMGVRGCEKPITEILKEPERAGSETTPETVQLFVYQEGEKVLLDIHSPHFVELQNLIEQRLTSATDKYQRLGMPRSAVELSASGTAVEIIYPKPKIFEINAVEEKISLTSLLIPLTEDPITTIYYTLQSQDYIEGPYISHQSVDEIKAILKSMNIELKQPTPGGKQQPPEQSSTQYRLRVRVTSMFDDTPIKNVSMEVVNKETEALVAKKKTNQEGEVEFILPSGSYNYRAEQPSNFKGGGDIELTKDSTRELKLLAVPQ